MQIRRAPLVATGVAALVLAALSGRADADTTAPADTSTFVSSFDGTKIQVHLFRTTVRAADGTAPVVAIAHGYGEQGPSDPDAPRLAGAPTLRPVLDAGYDVLTWDARGHGGSQGTAMIDSPDFEVRDTSAVLDWVAAQPGIRLDGPADPRVGMVGASYGGIIQFLLAAVDPRVDVLAPGYTAGDLARTSLAQNGKFKEGWGLALLGMGGIGTLPAGLASPLGPQLHGIDPGAVTGLLGSTARGTVTPELEAYFDHRSPHRVLDRIDVPTLIQGGTPDTIFTLDNLVDDFTVLKARGVPTKLVWNCEGHSLCPGDAGPLEEYFTRTVITWMDRWLRQDPSVDTGPEFTWIADNESSYRSAPAYPPHRVGGLRGTGTGTLALTAAGPLTSAGFVFIGAQPALAGATTVPIPGPDEGSAVDVVGFPRLDLTYRGVAAPTRTWVYAQVLDRDTRRIVGAQVTAVPLVLDGKQRSVSLDLNAIATRAAPGASYELQLLPGSLIFGLQRSTGAVQLSSITVTLPVIEAAPPD